MPVGSKLEICVGSINSRDYPGQHKISVLFEKRFSAVPIVTLCLVGDNKESVAENVTPTGFDIVISDTGQNNQADFKVDFQAFNVIGQ
tara:strand:- start:175 stop:438 length:264 start_codon:yes stop_codon:yes gene_type:complete